MTPASPAAAQPTVLMLLTNAYDPDPRVRQEALALIKIGCRVRLLAWDRDCKSPAHEVMEGVEVERVRLASSHGRGTTQVFFYAALYLRMFWRGWRVPFDAVHCHDLDTLPLGFLLGKLKRKPIVYDAHESFLEMFEGRVHPLVLRVAQGPGKLPAPPYRSADHGWRKITAIFRRSRRAPLGGGGQLEVAGGICAYAGRESATAREPGNSGRGNRRHLHYAIAEEPHDRGAGRGAPNPTRMCT